MSLLPLFPLDVVLLPGTSLPLHIFEPRYREMTAECLAAEKTIRRGAGKGRRHRGNRLHCRNCDGGEAVFRWAQRYSDPRRAALRGHACQSGAVVSAGGSPLPGRRAGRGNRNGSRASSEIASGAYGPGGSAAGRISTESPDQLSFRLAGPLPLDLDFKQTLLGMKSEAERLRAVIAYFETILPTIRRSVQVRQKAGGNGHAV